MERPKHAPKIVFARTVDGKTDIVEWVRHADTVWVITERDESVIDPDEMMQAWEDLKAQGFVEVYPNDQRKLLAEENRLVDLVRTAFRGVTLGNGVGLRQGQGLDDYADEQTLASLRAQDEKTDWSAIPVADLNQFDSSLSFFDEEGMRFHLPAYLIADLEDRLRSVDMLFYLANTDPWARSRFELLSPAQRDVVRQFLHLRLSDGNHAFQHAAVEAAIRDYWSR